MAQPKTPPASCRPGLELSAKLDAHCKATGKSRNAVLLEALEAHLNGPKRLEPLATVRGRRLPEGGATVSKLQVPLAGTFKTQPYQKTGRGR